ARDVDRLELARMVEARRRCHLGELLQRVAMEVGDPLHLVGHDECALAARVLCRYAGRAAVGMARLRLDAAYGEHEAARGIAPVGTERHRADDVEGGDDLAGGAELDAMARADADQRIVDEMKALAHRLADMV